MSKPYISILVDTYNHEGLIEDAVTSALAQDFPAAEREILVVDDGSTDQTLRILRKFEPKIRVLIKSNGGQASAFNYGIPECKGEIIAFLDGDDWWAPTKLSRVAEVFTDPEIGLVGHGIVEAFADGSRRAVNPEKRERLRIDTLSSAGLFRLRKTFLGTSRMTLRAEIAREIVPMPETLIIQADEYLFTLAAASLDLVILEDPLTFYRIHGGNLYLSSKTRSGLTRKQRSLAALASALQMELIRRNIPSNAVECIVEIIQAEADQLRLSLDGGSRWETLRTERKIFEVLHRDASLLPKIFRAATMSAALLLPPKQFYGGREWLNSQLWYRRLRKGFLPAPKITRMTGKEELG